MILLYLVLGFFTGFGCAGLSYVMGQSLMTCLVVYALTGHVVTVLGLISVSGKPSERGLDLERREIEFDLAALRERETKRRDAASAQVAPILFRALRLQEQRNNRIAGRKLRTVF